MKTLILILVFMVGNSCNQSTNETSIENSENPVESADNKDSNATPPIQESMNPGEVILKIKVMAIFDAAKDICGIAKTNVMKMEVQEVVGRGSSIVNLPNINNEVFMNFMLAPKNLSANDLIEVKARESLCKDTSKTYFTIISYKIVE